MFWDTMRYEVRSVKIISAALHDLKRSAHLFSMYIDIIVIPSHL